MSQPTRHSPVAIDTSPAFVEMLDQHQATSRLLESQPVDQRTFSERPKSRVSSRTISLAHQRSYSDDDDNVDGEVRALKSTTPTANDNKNRASKAVLWKGLPHHLVIWDLLNILFSICFLSLGACLASLEGKTESRWSVRVVQASKIAPSVWPVVFSGVLGSAVRAFADYKVERGVSLMGLEQLLGSVTMASSVITIFRWSIFQLSSIALLMLWAFNPLGSQASFRGVTLQSNIGTSQGNITFFSTNVTNQIYPFVDLGSSMTRSLYSSMLFDYTASTQYVDPNDTVRDDTVTILGGESSTAIQAATDIRGNVRIPSLEYLSDYDKNSPHRWLETPWDHRILNYSSLFGERIGGVDRSFTGNTTFTISSSYQHHDCAPWLNLSTYAPQVKNPSGILVSPNNSVADLWLLNNTYRNLRDNIYYPPFPVPRKSARKFFIAQSRTNMTNKQGISEVIVGSQGKGLGSLSVTKCIAQTIYVDANVTCRSRGALGKANCGVVALRQTINPYKNSSIVFDTMRGAQTGDASMFVDLMDMMEDNDAASSMRSSNTELYLRNPSTAFTRGYDEANLRYVEVAELDIGTFQRRFSLMWNTLYKTKWATTTFMGMGNMTTPAFQMKTTNTFQTTTSETTFPLPPIYVIDRAWLTLYFVSVSVMFLAAIFSLVVHSQCRAPAILGYVSSLIRDSTYFQDHGIYNNSAEDGPEKTRRLGKLRVMVADVRGEKEDAGKIAFAPVGMGKRVEKGRWYE